MQTGFLEIIPILGQETETFYYAQIDGLPLYTPGGGILPDGGVRGVRGS